MRQAVRFVSVLIVGLGLLAWVAYIGLVKTSRRWFETDIEMRSRLAAASARQSLVERWDDEPALEHVLSDVTRDERIMGAAACSDLGELRAATVGYPAEYPCSHFATNIGPGGGAGGVISAFTARLPGGPVHLSAVSLHDSGVDGFVVLVQDLGFMERREATTRNQLLAAFFVLSIGAALITLVAGRLAYKGWLKDLRSALLGGPARDFKPLVRDVRELVQKLSQEQNAEARGGAWNARRLRATLRKYLHGERVVVLANREPYVHELSSSGQVRVIHPASGLVTALEPVMRACSGVWVAHGSGSADRQTVDANNHVKVPPGEESYVVRRVWLSEEEEQGYYYGFSNEGLWPLCHVAHARPEFRDADWNQYRIVNQRFADAACDEVDSDDPVILIQDYHLALAPAMIRKSLPRATIITFWHIPWPNPERFGICPWRNEILQGLLGSSILGFHTRLHCSNFVEAVDTFVESRIDREQNAVVQGKRRTLIRPYPISIEWPVQWLSDLPSVEQCRKGVFEQLGLPPDALLGVGVDRLDYTKGIEERFAAVDKLLERFPEYQGRFTFVQLAAPSRTRIGRYEELNRRVVELAESINKRWETAGYRPIILLREHHEPPTVFRFFRAANLCYVSSLHDGMNLVAKEFVAAREDERGVLVLSQFTGAARELTEALIVNPYDLRQASDALVAAIRMNEREQIERMRSMRSVVAELNIYRWAGRMLIDAAQVRRRERLTGSLSMSSRSFDLEPV